MGLFDKVMQAVGVGDETVEVPNGRSAMKVYTYDGRPLKRIKPKDELTLTLVEGRHAMVSIYTGTDMEGNSALAYKGRLIGYLATGKNADLLKVARDRLGPLSLHATLSGWTRDGWPELTIHFDRKWVTDAIGR